MQMKKFVIAVAALAVGAAANANEAVVPVSAMAGPIEVRVDPTFELIGVVCHLAGYEEYNLSKKLKERDAVREWFEYNALHEAEKPALAATAII